MLHSKRRFAEGIIKKGSKISVGRGARAEKAHPLYIHPFIHSKSENTATLFRVQAGPGIVISWWDYRRILVVSFTTQRPAVIWTEGWTGSRVGPELNPVAYSRGLQAYNCASCSVGIRNAEKLIRTRLHQVTHSLVQLSPSWGAANCAGTQEIPSILWNPKVHYRVHKTPPLVHTLSPINPVHTIPSYLSKIHFNIVHPPTSWSS
jgi:hypothetical protein